jgi:biotin-dependent carboxylase-like uncharacterized protein
MDVHSGEPLLEVISPGILSHVQDGGRFHLAHLGISPAGAADFFALKVGNRLVGNKESAAAIEMTATGGSFRFLKEAWVACAGADFQPTLNRFPMAMWYSFRVKVGDTLAFGSPSAGLRSYLCIHGGIDVPVVLGSRSTLLSSSLGGFQGRELRSGDRIGAGLETEFAGAYRRAGIAVRSHYRSFEEIRVTRGPQWVWFDEKSQKRFFGRQFEVSAEANRRGVRLIADSGGGAELLRTKEKIEMLTEGISAGAIQVPPSGHPILLFCEQQTTGGYPKIANVIRADLFRIGQLRPGAKVRFREVSLEEAWAASHEMEILCRRSVNPA